MNDRSLRFGLLWRLGPVLILLLLLDALACYFTALHFGYLVYDRWLIDSARSLAQAVRSEHGQSAFDLPRVAVQIVQFDEVDKTYFRVSSAERGYIAGEASLPEALPVAGNGIGIQNGRARGEPVRIVSTRVSPPATSDSVVVTVAETLIKRSRLVHEIVLAMIAPQIALLGIAVLLAWLGISHGLRPLTNLASQIEARGQNNLTPLPEEGLPRETRVLARRINELLARLSHALDSQKRFVADAAHQLRTPLAALMLHAERARRAVDHQTEQEALRAVHRAVERAGRMTQQLLALARADPQASVAVELKPLDLAMLARRIGEEWIPRALERDIDFGLVVPDAPVRVIGDDRLLGELLSNLIDNALRYSSHSGRVSVIVQGGPATTLAVQDDGPGIPPEERGKIFQRFYRMPNVTAEGCGLGLAIVEEIARLHHATVSVGDGTDARGSRFTVTFQGLA
ncbi:MAG: sensor histidine kinase N-terminal domain-containing protein [Sinobacteraceae bacterium]|nr:sensor histidine kinase N-terminal domain-containing protein [Nevskiaceae bacterium]